MSIEELRKQYLDAAHAMQSAVALEMNYTDSHSLKHLRVGINSAHVAQLGLATLLLEKGVFTEEEYFEHQLATMLNEVKGDENKYGVKFE